MKKTLFVLTLCFSLLVKSQNYNNKWVVGISASVLNLQDNSLGRPLNVQAPKITISRYLFYGFILDGGFTLSGIGDIDGLFNNSFNYNSLDCDLRYNINFLSRKKIVPHLSIGSSFIGAPSSRPYSNPTATFNTSIGVTFWISNHWGINTQMTYKFSPKEFRSMVNHIQFTGGVVYSFRSRINVRRLWE